MTHTTSLGEAHARSRFRVWHLWLLALFVAVALANIRDQGRTEPALVALAAAGFVLFGLIGWGAWIVAGRFRARVGNSPTLILYLVAMAGLFLMATIAYLLIEHAYLVGGLDLARFPGVGRLPGRF